MELQQLKGNIFDKIRQLSYEIPNREYLRKACRYFEKIKKGVGIEKCQSIDEHS